MDGSSAKRAIDLDRIIDSGDLEHFKQNKKRRKLDLACCVPKTIYDAIHKHIKPSLTNMVVGYAAEDTCTKCDTVAVEPEHMWWNGKACRDCCIRKKLKCVSCDILSCDRVLHKHILKRENKCLTSSQGLYEQWILCRHCECEAKVLMTRNPGGIFKCSLCLISLKKEFVVCRMNYTYSALCNDCEKYLFIEMV